MSEVKEQERKPKRSRTKRILRWLAGFAVLFVIGSVASVEITSRSSFCNSCHIMGTYYDSWAAGTHKDVGCVECHIEPGAAGYIHAKLNGLGQVVDDLLNRTGTKPSASVSQFSCVREGCHVMSELAVPSNGDLKYKFDHQKHLNKTYKHVKIECTTCHSHVQGQNHFEVNTNACVTCHLHQLPTALDGTPGEIGMVIPAAAASDASTAEGAHPGAMVAATACRSCHIPPAEPIMHEGLEVVHAEFIDFGANCESCHRNVTAAAPHVTNQDCYGCHDFGLERMSDMDELHLTHTEGRHKVECFSCHGLIAHGPTAEIMSLNQFDCQNCHSDQHDLQRTAYLSEPHSRSGEALINPMFLAHVDCNGCHIKPRTLGLRPESHAMVKVAVPEACDACHQPGFGVMMIDLWQNTTRDMYDETFALLPDADSDWPPADDTARRQAVERARHLLEQVVEDGSWGVHNPRYTQMLIVDARELLVNAGALQRRDEE